MNSRANYNTSEERETLASHLRLAQETAPPALPFPSVYTTVWQSARRRRTGRKVCEGAK